MSPFEGNPPPPLGVTLFMDGSLVKERLNLKGIVTHSSGNHGQAVAYACSEDVANVPCIGLPKAEKLSLL